MWLLRASYLIAYITMEELEAQLEVNPNNWKTQRELLKQLRITKLRHSDLVLKYGEKLLTNHPRQLGSEGKLNNIIVTMQKEIDLN